MALDSILKAAPKAIHGTDDSQEREGQITKHLGKLRELIAYWRVYPDRFIDYLCSLNPHNTFHFFFYQRLFLRITMRHQYVYATFVRAWSKSFMSVMCLMIKAILYPRAKLFVVSGGKERIFDCSLI